MDNAGKVEEEYLGLSIVLPIYNEEKTVEEFLRNLIRELSAGDEKFEVIAVDDGSDDGTLDVLTRLINEFPSRLKVAKHLYNRGNGSALRTGIRTATGRVVVTMDADGQHSPDDINRLVSHIPPYDLVIGARTDSYRGSWYRGVANRFYNRFASWLSRSEIADLTSGFRAMRRSVVDHFLPLFPTGFSAPTTTTLAFLKAGYNVKFIPINVASRQAGRSKVALWSDGSNFILIIIRMIMLYDPMRIFIPTGLILGIIGLLAGVAGIINAKRLVLANSAILFLLAGLVTWLLGFIASQISSTLIQYQGDETIELLEPSKE